MREASLGGDGVLLAEHPDDRSGRRAHVVMFCCLFIEDLVDKAADTRANDICVLLILVSRVPNLMVVERCPADLGPLNYWEDSRTTFFIHIGTGYSTLVGSAHTSVHNLVTTGRNVAPTAHRRLSHNENWLLGLRLHDWRGLRVALMRLFDLLLCLLLNSSRQLLNVL